MHDSIAAQVLALCRERGLTLSAAESITGGLIAKCITDVPGASQVFLGGVVSYTNGVKERVLHVPRETLEKFDLGDMADDLEARGIYDQTPAEETAAQ